MLDLSTIVLLSIDVAHPLKAVAALATSMQWCRFKQVILLTDVRKHRGIVTHAVDNGITVANHTESNTAVTLPGIKRKFFKDYELAHMTLLAEHVGNASHVLYMESDAGVVNHEAWNKFWFSYDFIGAPWPPHAEAGLPLCDGVTNAVGNTGFSLRSRDFCHAAAECVSKFSDDPLRIASDAWLCRTKRQWFETKGIEFAPADVAARFSCENRIYSGQFGFHGHYTARINGWNWPGI